MVLMISTFFDVSLRYLIGWSIIGIYDISGLTLLVISAFSLAQGQVKKIHISIDFFIRKLKPRIRAVILSVSYLVGSGLFAVLTWRSVVHGISLLRVGEVTQTIKIPLGPFAYMIAFSSAVLCIVLLLDLIKSLREIRMK
jgi:TRAP-type C4-dicarboxylate transport system permease small subunit